MKGRIIMRTVTEVVNGQIERVNKPIYFLGAREVSEAEFKAHFPDRAGLPMMSGIAHGCWPMRSQALAVHRKQVAQANERNARLGLSTHYEPDGTAVIPDRAERTRLCKVEGVFDNHAGYGDFAGDGPAAYKGRITGNDDPEIPLNVEIGAPQ